MIISIANQQKDMPLKGLQKTIRMIVYSFMLLELAPYRELSLVFVTDSFMRKLHATHFQDPTSTDVITFPLDEESGELYICPKTALLYAEKHHLDPYTELTLYLVHGMLHLLGYDDLCPKARKVMRKLEKKHMTYLGKQGLILHA